jgi:putative acetyltransferase
VTGATVLLRREQPADRAAIFAVHHKAFDNLAEPRLVDDLRDDGDIVAALSLVATFDDEVVGHVVCSPATVDERPSLGLGPLGVLPAHQRRGVGQALMHGVLAAADALGEPAVVLLGDPAYYRRFGFVLAETVWIAPPEPRWAPHFQVRKLSNWDDTLRGTFRYARAFDRL